MELQLLKPVNFVPFQNAKFDIKMVRNWFSVSWLKVQPTLIIMHDSNTVKSP